jgi:antitoxin component YwqK of YwqJK toxin-antitoxin module
MKIYIFLLLSYISCSSLDLKNSQEEISFEPPNVRIERFPETFNLKAKGTVRCVEQTCNPTETKPEKLKTLLKHGKWEEYIEKELPNGKKQSFLYKVGQYTDNLRTGIWEEYSIKEETQSNYLYTILDRMGRYENGKKEGIWEFYYDEGPNVKKGKLLRKTNYKNDLKEGQELRYSKEGIVIEESNYKNDLLEGRYIKKTNTGEIEKEGQYSQDKKTGEWREYQFYEPQKKMVLRSITNYLDDKRHGLQILYTEDGKYKRAEGNFANGLEIGLWKYFYDNGNIQLEGNFRPVEFIDPEEVPTKDKSDKPKARRMGTWKKYYKSGTLFAEGNMDGKPVGEWKYYHKNKNLAARGIMKNEFMMEQGSLYDIGGNLMAEGKFMISMVKLNEKTDELELTYKPTVPFVFYKNGVKYLELTSEVEDGKNIALLFEGGTQVGRGPIDIMTQKKNGCWTINGKKIYYMMDKVVTGPLAKMQKCE